MIYRKFFSLALLFFSLQLGAQNYDTCSDEVMVTRYKPRSVLGYRYKIKDLKKDERIILLNKVFSDSVCLYVDSLMVFNGVLPRKWNNTLNDYQYFDTSFVVSGVRKNSRIRIIYKNKYCLEYKPEWKFKLLILYCLPYYSPKKWAIKYSNHYFVY